MQILKIFTLYVDKRFKTFKTIRTEDQHQSECKSIINYPCLSMWGIMWILPSFLWALSQQLWDNIAVKNPLTNAGDIRDEGSIPRSGRFPWRRAWQTTPGFLPEEFHGQRSLVGYSHRVAKSRTPLKQLSTHAPTKPRNRIRNWKTCNTGYRNEANTIHRKMAKGSPGLQRSDSLKEQIVWLKEDMRKAGEMSASKKMNLTDFLMGDTVRKDVYFCQRLEDQYNDMYMGNNKLKNKVIINFRENTSNTQKEIQSHFTMWVTVNNIFKC